MFQLKVTHQSFKLAIAVSSCLSGLMLLGSGWSDFQNVAVYEVPTHLNNEPSKYLIQRQFDRKIKDIPNDAKVISRIDQGNPYGKIFFCFVGMSLSIATLMMINHEDKVDDLINYINDKKLEVAKMKVDNEVALADYNSDQYLMIRAGQEQAELEKNPFWVKLQKEKENILYGEDEESTINEPVFNQKEINDLWADTPTNNQVAESSVDPIVSKEEAIQIWKLHHEKEFKLSTAIAQVTGYKPSNPNWNVFKTQLINHFNQLKNN